jgi:hypothetical protein
LRHADEHERQAAELEARVAGMIAAETPGDERPKEDRQK